MITVSGIAQVQKNLRLISSAMRVEAAKEINETAREIRELARQLVPVNTGKLQKSIRVIKRAHRGRLSAKIGSVRPYARFVEFGTKDAQANPYLYPAAEVKSPTFRKRMTDAAKRGLRPASMDVGFARAQQVAGEQ